MELNQKTIRKWSGHDWVIVLTDLGLDLKCDDKLQNIPCDGSVSLKPRRRWFRWHLEINGQSILKLTGASRFEATLISKSTELTQARQWSESLEWLITEHRRDGKWISREDVDRMMTSRPTVDFKFLNNKSVADLGLIESEIKAIKNLKLDLVKHISIINNDILKEELEDKKDFLNRIESKPLTLEQSEAVISFDNRVLVVAAAGSGKTSVMVARAAYAVEKEFVKPSRILLLSFNKAAAKELQERIQTRFSSVGIDSTGINASTFHKFGLDVLGQVSNSKPSVAKWLDDRDGLNVLMQIVNKLKSDSAEFKYKWELFKLIFAPETVKIVGIEADSWDPESRKNGFRTFDGKLVKSHGERMISNWLYLYGVDYEYERNYTVKTSDSNRSQYAPDFYYPLIDAWHEHWAVDEFGNPPNEFVGYLQSMRWKQNLHKRHMTDLIETTFGGVVYSDGLMRLKEELESRGLVLKWNPERPKAAFTAIEDSELLGLFRTFLYHVKSNSLTQDILNQRILGKWNYLKGYRTDLFLYLFWNIHDAWNKKLDVEGSIDFEDMLIKAAECIEGGQYKSEYDLILVDEFQDTSAARARIIKALLKEMDKYLLVVGDDWQAINRFAGSDIAYMTKFHEIFGEGPSLKLSKTFRCTQTISDVASWFVTKNPNQISKKVISIHADPGPQVSLIRSKDEYSGVNAAMKLVVDDMKLRGSKSSSAFVLGRYRFNLDWVPRFNYPEIRITFKTIHSSKGLEADYVIIVNAESGRFGFPSEIEDDPILNLAMETPEYFLHAEERRLLYVALTRARRKAILVSREHKESVFLAELIIGDQIKDESGITSNNNLKTCPKCHKGILVLRKRRYGHVYECPRFPRCLFRSR